MAYIKGSQKGSVRYHFYTADEAWKFAKEMTECKRTVVDYGKDDNRHINKYYIDLK